MNCVGNRRDSPIENNTDCVGRARSGTFRERRVCTRPEQMDRVTHALVIDRLITPHEARSSAYQRRAVSWTNLESLRHPTLTRAQPVT